MRLFRAMQEAEDGMPVVGRSSRKLGVRTSADVQPNVEPDVTAVRPDDIIKPTTGGMSTAPDDAYHLPPMRRPLEMGGRGRDPVWFIECDDLPPALVTRQDSATHALIEPTQAMTLADFEAFLASTRPNWSKFRGAS